jgi:hypothetical protein
LETPWPDAVDSRTVFGAIVIAAVVGAACGALAYELPVPPRDAVGAIAVGGVAALFVVVGYLVGTLRDRDRRLDRIEEVIAGLDPEDTDGQ